MADLKGIKRMCESDHLNVVGNNTVGYMSVGDLGRTIQELETALRDALHAAYKGDVEEVKSVVEAALGVKQ